MVAGRVRAHGEHKLNGRVSAKLDRASIAIGNRRTGFLERRRPKKQRKNSREEISIIRARSRALIEIYRLLIVYC